MSRILPAMRMHSRQLTRPQLQSVWQHVLVRHNSTAGAPPLLLKLREDLKTSMRAKDAPRLNVIRAVLADVTEASKTARPVSTDIHILGFIQKRIAQGKASSDEFSKDGRNDLKDKEDGQVKILEEYAGNVQTVGEDEVRQQVAVALIELGQSGGKVNKGSLMKKLVGPGGLLEGQPVEKQLVANAVDEAIGSAS